MNLSPFFKELAGLLPGGRRGAPADALSPGPGTASSVTVLPRALLRLRCRLGSSQKEAV